MARDMHYFSALQLDVLNFQCKPYFLFLLLSSVETCVLVLLLELFTHCTFSIYLVPSTNHPVSSSIDCNKPTNLRNTYYEHILCPHAHILCSHAHILCPQAHILCSHAHILCSHAIAHNVLTKYPGNRPTGLCGAVDMTKFPSW